MVPMPRGRRYGPVFGGVRIRQIASRCLLYSIDSADFTAVWERAGNMFVALHPRNSDTRIVNGLDSRLRLFACEWSE